MKKNSVPIYPEKTPLYVNNLADQMFCSQNPSIVYCVHKLQILRLVLSVEFFQ